MAEYFVLPIVFVLVGLGCFAWTSVQALRSIRARRWATATATIRAHEIEEFKEKRDQLYEPDALKVRYLYEVDGRLYTSERLFFGDHRVKANAAYYAGYLAAGDHVTIHYDPKDPAESVIETRVHPALKRVIGVGITMIVAAPLVALWERKPPVFPTLSNGTMLGLIAVMIVAPLLVKLYRDSAE